jgi:hypothetical protein
VVDDISHFNSSITPLQTPALKTIYFGRFLLASVTSGQFWVNLHILRKICKFYGKNKKQKTFPTTNCLRKITLVKQ